jgi:hypothetical protein
MAEPKEQESSSIAQAASGCSHSTPTATAPFSQHALPRSAKSSGTSSWWPAHLTATNRPGPNSGQSPRLQAAGGHDTLTAQTTAARTETQGLVALSRSPRSCQSPRGYRINVEQFLALRLRCQPDWLIALLRRKVVSFNLGEARWPSTAWSKKSANCRRRREWNSSES